MTIRDLVASSLLPPGRRRRSALGTLLACDPAGRPLPLNASLEQLILQVAPDRDSPGALAAELRREADAAIARAGEARFHLIGWRDARYPASLRVIPDPPPVLWMRGDPACLALPSIAIVGSRAASPYGLSVARQLAGDLAAAGVTIVSGLARGCDGVAHQGALDAGGRTVAVVGCGVDVIYPREHRSLSDAIAATGTLVSELAPGTPPLPAHFPLRNRLIAGLSAAVVVIEASSRSGSLITAACALDQGREVMAVPGNVLSDRHTGCHELLRDGACLVQTARDVLEALGWVDAAVRQKRTGSSRASPVPDAARAGEARGAELSTGAFPAEPSPVDNHQFAPVLGFLPPGEALDLDDLAARSGLKPEQLLPELTRLELAGTVRRLSGGRFMRSSG